MFYIYIYPSSSPRLCSLDTGRGIGALASAGGSGHVLPDGVSEGSLLSYALRAAFGSSQHPGGGAGVNGGGGGGADVNGGGGAGVNGGGDRGGAGRGGGGGGDGGGGGGEGGGAGVFVGFGAVGGASRVESTARQLALLDASAATLARVSETSHWLSVPTSTPATSKVRFPYLSILSIHLSVPISTCV